MKVADRVAQRLWDLEKRVNYLEGRLTLVEGRIRARLKEEYDAREQELDYRTPPP